MKKSNEEESQLDETLRELDSVLRISVNKDAWGAQKFESEEARDEEEEVEYSKRLVEEVKTLKERFPNERLYLSWCPPARNNFAFRTKFSYCFLN